MSAWMARATQMAIEDRLCCFQTHPFISAVEQLGKTRDGLRRQLGQPRAQSVGRLRPATGVTGSARQPVAEPVSRDETLQDKLTRHIIRQ
jgi:hypothetical protein